MSSFIETFSSASNCNVAFGTDAATTTSLDVYYSVLDYFLVSSNDTVPFPLAAVYCSSTSWYKIWFSVLTSWSKSCKLSGPIGSNANVPWRDLSTIADDGPSSPSFSLSLSEIDLLRRLLRAEEADFDSPSSLVLSASASTVIEDLPMSSLFPGLS